jgi:hypothetical protein
MTIDTIRHFLFEIKNQEMTIKELRSKLFDLKDTDKDLSEEEITSKGWLIK